MDEALLMTIAGAHRDSVQDAVEIPRERRLPRHRARRPRWKPPRSASGLQTVQPKHAYDRETLVG